MSRLWKVLMMAALLGGILWIAISSGIIGSGEGIEIGNQWTAKERISYQEIDHSTWSELLKKYVDSDGLVNYQGLKSSTADLATLDRYLAQLARADESLSASREAKMAFWINAYNAVTIQGILREYPTTSIRNHTSPLGYNIWDDLKLRVGGQSYSLNEIEHAILRKMGEPRIHFAIVCASIGCPRLLSEAYLADRLDIQLTENARHFFSLDQNFHSDSEAGQVFFSSILNLFKEDFGSSQTERLQNIVPYLPDEESRQTVTNENVKVKYLEYDWNLNEQK